MDAGFTPLDVRFDFSRRWSGHTIGIAVRTNAAQK